MDVLRHLCATTAGIRGARLNFACVVPYYRHFGLERDPFLDTADPSFYCETPAIRRYKHALLSSVAESRGLAIVVGEPGTGKTSLCTHVEHEIMRDETLVIGKVLDPSFASDIEFLLAIGRVFGLSLPPRSNAALKNALKNYFFDMAVLEEKTIVLIIDEAQNLSDESQETLRLLLNFQIPQKKLLNILLFGQPELEARVAKRQNFADRVDRWIRLEPLDHAGSLALIDHRLTQAGQTTGRIFSPEASDVLVAAAAGLPRRLTTLAHVAMREAAERGSAMVFEDHALAAVNERGLRVPLKAEPPRSTPSMVTEVGFDDPPLVRWFKRFAREVPR